MATWFSCKPCSESDPTSDTVKVDASLLINKENVQPQPQQIAKEERQRRHQAEEDLTWIAPGGLEATRRQKEQAAAEAAAEAARVRAEAEKAASERAQCEEVAHREAQEEARQEAVQRAAAERARQEEEAARAAVAQAAAAAAAAEEQRRRREAAEDQARIAHDAAVAKANEWCSKNGFPDLNTQKKTFRGATKTPLHTAVKYHNQEMVGVLLAAGVDKYAKDSKNQTPGELAAKLNKNGSHEPILTMLR